MKRKNIFDVCVVLGVTLCLLYFISCPLHAISQENTTNTSTDARVVSEQRVQELKDLHWGMFLGNVYLLVIQHVLRA
ncbi:MAG: hypothetical protein LBE12_01515 [Planctomycetaceae bacterium]|jgi:hypothetical protein|nr:hypothetical protein [Planctomycetaceae bacterium]